MSNTLRMSAKTHVLLGPFPASRHNMCLVWPAVKANAVSGRTDGSSLDSRSNQTTPGERFRQFCSGAAFIPDSVRSLDRHQQLGGERGGERRNCDGATTCRRPVVQLIAPPTAARTIPANRILIHSKKDR